MKGFDSNTIWKHSERAGQHANLSKNISAKNLLAKAMDAFRVPAFASVVA